MSEDQDTGNPSARQVLLDVATRCETEEPSRELDISVYLATRLPAAVAATTTPKYTTSLDAAVTLVPKWAAWQITQRSDDGGYDAVIVTRDAVINYPFVRITVEEVETAAAAVAAASLRARAEAL